MCVCVSAYQGQGWGQAVFSRLTPKASSKQLDTHLPSAELFLPVLPLIQPRASICLADLQQSPNNPYLAYAPNLPSSGLALRTTLHLYPKAWAMLPPPGSFP